MIALLLAAILATAPALREGDIVFQTRARTSVYAATSPGLEGVTGRYLNHARIAAPRSGARDEAAQKRLWESSEKLVDQAAVRR